MAPAKYAHQIISEHLRNKILSENYAVGDKLPSTASIAGTYNVSVVTAVKSVKKLVDEGILQTRRGVGISVKRLPERKVSDQKTILAIGSIHQPVVLSKYERVSIAECIPGWQLFETSIDDENCKDLHAYLDRFFKTHNYDYYILKSVSEEVKRYF